ncbi:hypothetical protein N41_0143 [Lactococcus cremoris]|nr:hypothetical protein N41_0143 [Lactococcus cremoris]
MSKSFLFVFVKLSSVNFTFLSVNFAFYLCINLLTGLKFY